MKRLIAALAFVCLAASARAQAPACIQITDTLYSVGVLLPVPMTGTIDLTLGYFAADGAWTIVQSQARQTITGGALNTCLVPGNYSALFSIVRPAPLTGAIRSTQYWTVPSSGGPYTVQTIQTPNPPNPPIYTLSATPPVTYTAGVIALSFTPENLANKDAVNGYAGLTAGGLLKLAEAPIWNQNTTGLAATATALAAIPSPCGTGFYADAIAANGNLTCATVQFSQLGGSVPAITALTGDGSATGPGSSAFVLNLVGGSTAANVHLAELNANAVLSAAGSTSDLFAAGFGALNNQNTTYGTVHHDVALGPGAYNLGIGSGCNSMMNCAAGPSDIEDSLAIGWGAGNSASGGTHTDGAATQAIAIGSQASNSWICGVYSNTGPISIGVQAYTGCRNSIMIGSLDALGNPATNWGADAIGIGAGVTIRAVDSILIGTDCIDNTAGGPFVGIALGNHCALYANGQFVLGGDIQDAFGGIHDLFVGPPVTDYSQGYGGGGPITASINPCGAGHGFYDTGSSANLAGCGLSVNGGKGTGSGSGGTIYFATAPAGGSGSTPNALVNRISIGQTGTITYLGFSASGKVPVCFNNGVIYAGSNSGTPCP